MEKVKIFVLLALFAIRQAAYSQVSTSSIEGRVADDSQPA